MRLLRHLLPTVRRPGASRRYALAPAAYRPLELDFDPMLNDLANQCR